MKFLPLGRADTPFAQLQNARVRDSGDDRRVGGDNAEVGALPELVSPWGACGPGTQEERHC